MLINVIHYCIYYNYNVKDNYDTSCYQLSVFKYIILPHWRCCLRSNTGIRVGTTFHKKLLIIQKCFPCYRLTCKASLVRTMLQHMIVALCCNFVRFRRRLITIFSIYSYLNRNYDVVATRFLCGSVDAFRCTF